MNELPEEVQQLVSFLEAVGWEVVAVANELFGEDLIPVVPVPC